MERAEQAVEFKHSGFNCCQAVLKAFEDRTGMTDEQLKAVGSGFGGGMGCMKATCGALVGANMVLGLANDTGKPTTAVSREMLQEFEEKSGATICGDLKGIGTGKVLCECDDCIRNAVKILESKI